MSIRIHWDVTIPMRDGCRLAATVYIPEQGHLPSPCIVTMTPYVADRYHDRAKYFAENGFVYVVVDVRGRGNSEGTFRPLIQEAQDGHDVIEWVSRLDLCNGKVAMKGASYGGYCQWAAAKECPPGLVTIVPTTAAFPGVDFPMRNNIFYPYLVRWLAYVSGRASQPQLFADDTFWSRAFYEWHVSGAPFAEIDGILGSGSEIFQEWIAHSQLDAYWDQFNPTREQYARIDYPVLSITGHWDDDQAGTLAHYRNSVSARGDAAGHYLIIGPWDHSAASVPRREIGGLQFGPQSVIDAQALHLSWYRWVMCDGPRPEFLKKPIAYYVTGSECWRYADTLNDISAERVTFFLASERNANDVLAAGELTSQPRRGAPDHYTYDPRILTGPEVAAELTVDGASLVDQSVVLALGGRLLVYQTVPLEHDLDVCGFFILEAWISIDRPDADFYATIYEVRADGQVLRLSTDALRARHRQGPKTSNLIRTQEPLLYRFENFTFVARTVRRGCRLRLALSPVGRLINATFAERNFSGGGVVAEERPSDGGPVTVKLFHEDARSSSLSVPVGRRF